MAGFDARELGGRPITRVILTHHHPDHVGLAGWFKSEYGAEIWATRTAWLMARMLTLDVQELPTSETLDFWRKAGMDPVELDKRAKENHLISPILFTQSHLGFTVSRKVMKSPWVVELGIFVSAMDMHQSMQRFGAGRRYRHIGRSDHIGH